MNVAIIGGGLAGLLTCRALLASGVAADGITVIDVRDRRRGSDNPGALLHPFPGRLLEPKTGVLSAYRAARAVLDETLESHPQVSHFRGPMVRPILAGEVGETFEASWREHRDDYGVGLDDGMLSGDELAALGPFAEDIEKAIVYGPAYCVDLAGWLGELRARFEDRGVTFVDARAESIERRPTSWRVEVDGDSIAAEHCVLAVGAHLGAWFPELNIRPTGGALLVVDAGALELNAATSAGGHIAPIDERRWVAGATWWHDDEFETVDDAQAAASIVERVKHLVPRIGELERVAVWRGERAVHANDRRPLVGEVPGQRGLYVCGGFGSKGLLWSPLMARALADSIVGRARPPEFARATRLGRSWWRPGDALRL
jgi:glycine/D-amino acid oxidase-like deaminating enzyme